MSRARMLLFVTLGVLGAAPIAAIHRVQSAQRPVRDVRTEPAGTGVISGVVQEDGEAQRPLRRAAVRISGDPLLTSRQVYTRDDGSFVFDGLPAGQYTLSAQRATYMTAEYGARRPGGSGSAIVLGNGQRLTNIVFTLSRYAAITGVIYDQNGEPAPNISVEALKYTMRTGRRTLSSVYGQPSTTDDRGVYRLGGLSPGEYYVAAGPSPDRGPMDVQQLTAADVDRVLQLISAPTPASSIDVSFAQPHQGFAPVYFPGSIDFPGAQSIALTLGEERGGIDIRLQLVRTVRIDGTLDGPDGRPVTGIPILATPVTEASSLDLFSPSVLAPAAADAQGRFSFPAVVPGRYIVSARMPDVPGGQAGPLWASAEVDVGGADQTIALALQPGMTVSGRVVFSGTTIPPPANMAGVRVSLANPQTVFSVFYPDPLGVAPVAVNPDGTFTLIGATPGRYRLASAPPVAPPGWALRSAIANGVDTLDVPFTITPGQPIDNVVVTFTDRPTELSGTLQTPAGTPTADYFIVLFASDRAFWTTSSRRSVMARPASTGKYVVRNLPPGEYLVAAVTDVENGDWWDPAFLDRLVPAATRITLSEGERKTLDLKIGG